MGSTTLATTNSTLSHSGSQIVTLDEVERIPAGESRGPRHRPVKHIDLVRGVKDAFVDRGYSISTETYSITREGARLFGILELTPVTGRALTDPSEAGMAVGLRHANDQAFALGVIAGMRLFVCDNLVFTGGRNILRKKHTTHLDLRGSINAGMQYAFQGYHDLQRLCDRLKDTPLSDTDAKLLIYGMALEGKVIAPSNLGQVHAWYFDPESVATEPDRERGFADVATRTAWSVFNAVTRVTRSFAPHRQQDTSVELGCWLDGRLGLGVFSPYHPAVPGGDDEN